MSPNKNAKPQLKSADPRLMWLASVLAMAVAVLYVTHI
jgi:hypothetical protein